MAPHVPTALTPDRRRGRLGAALAAAVLVLAAVAGCSADGGDDAEATTTTTEATTTEATTTTGSSGSTTTRAEPAGEASMTPADGWTDVDESMLPEAVVSAFGAPETTGGFTDNVNLLVEEGKADDLDEYWERSEDGLAAIPDAEELEPRSDIEMDGHPAYQKVWTAESSGRRLQFWSVLSAVDGDGYVFTYTASPDSFEDHRADAEEMFESVRIPG